MKMRKICLMMIMLYEARSMPYALHLGGEMMHGFLIALVPTTFATYEIFSVLTLNQTVQF